MKSFFQSYSFLWNIGSLRTLLLQKIDFGWALLRMFVLALVAYVVLSVIALVGFFAMKDTIGYDFSKETVSQDVRIVSDNFLSYIPKDIEFGINEGGFRNNLQGPIQIQTTVLFSGTSFDSLLDYQDGPRDLALITIDSTSDDKEITQTSSYITLNASSLSVYDGKKLEQRPWIDQGIAFTGENEVIKYKNLVEIQTSLVQGIHDHRDRFVSTMWIVIAIGGIFFVLFSALIVSLYTILVAYLWNLITWAIASITKKGRDYEQSYTRTLLASFPFFVLNRFVEIPWYIDVVMVVVLVFVMEMILQKDNK